MIRLSALFIVLTHTSITFTAIVHATSGPYLNCLDAIQQARICLQKNVVALGNK